MKGIITLEFHLSKESELEYYEKYSSEEVLESIAKYWINVTPEVTGIAKVLSIKALDEMKDRRSKKEKKIEKEIERMQKETKRKRRRSKKHARKTSKIKSSRKERKI